MTTRCGLTALALATLWASASLAIGSSELYGHDAVSMGRGTAIVADDSGPAAAFVNPAALSRLRGPALHGGFQLALPVLAIDTDRTFAADDPLRPANPAPVAGFALGFGAPLELIVKDRIAVGLTAYLPSVALVRARAYDPARPSWYVYDSATEHYELFAAASVRIVDGAAVGFGARLGAGQGGSATLVLDPVRSRFTRQELDTSQFAVNSLIAGLLLGPWGFDDIKVRGAFVMRDRSSFDVDLPASLTIGGLDVGLVLDLVTLSNFSPRTWTGGLQLDLLQTIKLAVDMQYAQWSEAPSPFLRVRNDVAGEGLERLGFGEALDAPGPGQERVVSPGFVDTLNVRVGGEGEVMDGVIVRGGYAWRPTPVPDQTSGSNIVDNSAHTIAVGAGVRADLPLVAERPFWFNVGYQAIVMQPRRAEKTSSRDAIGSWTSSGTVHHVALEFRYFW
jgi:long-subunit fatty acid transport protein